MVDVGDSKPTDEAYEPPCAVYLSEVATGAGKCVFGSGPSTSSAGNCSPRGNQATSGCHVGNIPH
jgi:hypothetical protein